MKQGLLLLTDQTAFLVFLPASARAGIVAADNEIERIAAGDVIPGGSGLRKLRWAAKGRGKRGGARVIYYRHVPGERIYLIYAYLKTEQADLTREQLKVLAQLMKDVKHG